MDEKLLIKKAVKAMENAYAPYSGFKVGACVLTSDGTEFTGCNIENASFGLTVCAERVALFKAYSEGKRDIIALAVAADVDEPVSPCGACRQVMMELSPDALVILSNRDGSKVMRTGPGELLPYGFKL
ncbi:Cytidine deaminase [Fervidicola ferrireducens]|uniref:Cytidine deaminase n=1 Tax=Fervidicola ferrireducens TaxID=520764 RepID=A0A140LAF8_9FIRM|nr:cytidine deaminase [Fervidicola ferrireducens]KXG77533.1 Cytidine deaminase [Fervidicola ferrireducens]